MYGFKHKAIILMRNSQIDVVWPDLTGRDLRLDSIRNNDSKNSEIPKIESVRGP